MRDFRYSMLVVNFAAVAVIATSLPLQPALSQEDPARAEQAQQEVESPAATPIAIADMRGTWFATLSGLTGCGVTTLVTTFTLDEKGNGTQISAIEHTAGCGDLDQSGQIAQMQKLNSNGSGFIALGCGEGCGFGFHIQVSRSHNFFNMGPQPVPGNYLAGVAIRR